MSEYQNYGKIENRLDGTTWYDQDYVDNIQQENKQLKEKSDVLEENNKLLIQQKSQMYEDLDIAYERIDKAIEYINNASYFDGSSMCANDLLEILGGINENNNI